MNVCSGDDEFSLFLRKAFIKGAGYSDDALNRPIIGIIDTSSRESHNTKSYTQFDMQLDETERLPTGYGTGKRSINPLISPRHRHSWISRSPSE